MRGELVGMFVADLLVNDVLIVETKAIQTLAKAHEVQVVNYLTATGLNEGLLLNFGTERLEFKKKFRLPKTDATSANPEIILWILSKTWNEGIWQNEQNGQNWRRKKASRSF